MNSRNNTHAWSSKGYWQDRFNLEDTPWELGAPSSVVCEALDYLVERGVIFSKVRALVAGCGRGSDALECARRGTNVLALDWSDTAVAETKAAYTRVRGAIAGTLEVIQADFFALPPEQVDLVCEHTFFCAIDPSTRSRYAERMALWLKPGGCLCGNFFVVSPDEAVKLPGLSLTKDGEGPPFASTEREILDLFSTNFEVLIFRPALHPEQTRRPGIEWVGVFRRKGT